MQASIKTLIDKHNPVIAIISISDINTLIPMVQTLKNKGINAIEITLRTPLAYEGIKMIREHFPELFLCVGTVTHAQQLDLLSTNDVDLIVTPGVNKTLLDACKNKQLSVLPGVATPSDILLGIEYGLDCYKFFPAQAMGGIKTLQALQGPFSNIHFCATGGVNEENYKDYLAQENVFAVAGSWLTNS